MLIQTLAPGRPVAPWEIADAVTAWARDNGREGARLVWSAPMKCWCIEFDLKADDPRMAGWRDGRLKRKPVETVVLHKQKGTSAHFEAMDLEQMGASGIRALLDEGNLWSGTGKYPGGLMEAVKAVEEKNDRVRAEFERVAVENARLRARDERSWVTGTPRVSVPDNIESA